MATGLTHKKEIRKLSAPYVAIFPSDMWSSVGERIEAIIVSGCAASMVERGCRYILVDGDYTYVC